MKRFLSLLLSTVLACSLLAVPAAAVELPGGWWPVWSAFTEACDNGSTEEAIAAGNKVIQLYTANPMNVDIASGLYMVYLHRLESLYFESKGDYAAAIDNVEKLIGVCEFLEKNGKDYQDMLTRCRAHLGVLSPNIGVYAASYAQKNAYGSDIAAASGSFYGSIAEGSYGDRSIASFYVELDSQSAADFDYLISPKADGKRVILVNLNFQQEGSTARAVPTGAYDGNLRSTLNYLKTLKSPVLLRIGAEMDVWSNSVTGAEFIAAYEHIAAMARSIAPGVELIWSPNYVSGWNVDVEDYYPNNDLVDWVGTSLYYSFETQDLSETTTWLEYTRGGRFADPIAAAERVHAVAEKHNKPMIVTEGGASKSGAEGISAIAAKVGRNFSTLNMVYPRIKAIVYFDRSFGANDYSLTGEVKSAADAAVSANPALIAKGKTSGATWIPIEKLNESASGTLLLGAHGSTYQSLSMSASYKLDGSVKKSTSGSPNHFSLDLASLSAGAHKLEVTLSDTRGYSVTKTYTLTLSDGTVKCSEGWSGASAPVPPAAPIVKAKESRETITLNGSKVTLPTFQLFDANGGGTNYVRLRDIAALLDGTYAQFDVSWNGKVVIVPHTAYASRNGTEGVSPFRGDQPYTKLGDSVLVGGAEKTLDGIVLTDSGGGGHTYFKLRDLGTQCGFAVDWQQGVGIIINA